MNVKKISRFFPPPQFLNIPYAGLSISDTSVRCIQFGRRGNSLFVKKYAERPLPEGAVVSGFIQHQDEVARVISDIRKEIGVEYLKVSLPEEKGYLFTTKIPMVAPKEVRSTIEFTIEENVPLSASDLIFDYSIANTAGHGDHIDVIVSAVPKTIIDYYIETIRKVGAPLLSLEIESQAIARALVPIDSTDTRLIVYFGREKVGLYVVHKRIVHFTSTVPIVVSSPEDMAPLSQEIKRLYVYWHTLKENAGEKDKQIHQIVLCGEQVTGAYASYLSAKHDTRTVLGNVWTNALDIATAIPPIPFEDSLRFASAIGLALPSSILI